MSGPRCDILGLTGTPGRKVKSLILSAFLSSYAFLWVPPFFFSPHHMTCNEFSVSPLYPAPCPPPQHIVLPRHFITSLSPSSLVVTVGLLLEERLDLLLLDGLLLEERLDLTDLGKIIQVSGTAVSKESKLDKYLKHA